MNRHQSINMRQLCCGYFLYSISIKILSLPAALAQGCGSGAWLAACGGIICELLLVAIATIILKFSNHNQLFFRILCWVMLPLMIAGIVITIKEIYQLAYVDLFTDLGLIIFSLTLIALGLFFITRKPRAVFRTGEILWCFFALGLIIAVVPTLYNMHWPWSDLRVTNFPAVLSSSGSHLLWFETATFILAFGSETPKSNRDLGKINLTAWLCGIGYGLAMILFCLLFGPLGPLKTQGIIDLTTASQFITNNGSLDWLIGAAILSALILRFGVQIVAGVTLIKRGCGRRD